jgi:protein transport protein SEC24
MSAPHDQYGHPYGQQPQQPQYDQFAQQPGYAQATSPPPTAGGEQQQEGGKKKKRGYAAHAYDFGAGANSALGGQQPAGGAYPPAAAPAYGGYPVEQTGYGVPSQPYAAPVAPQAPISPTYGAPPAMAGLGGYQPPDVGYPGPGVPPAGVTGITQGMGQMGLGGGPGQAPAHQQPQSNARPLALNPLYPTDLLNQPFNVAELELPPPPLILPPNVSLALLAISLD